MRLFGPPDVAKLLAKADRDGLIRASGDRSVRVRMDAVSALGRLGDPVATASLVAALADPDAGVRKTAARALRSLGPPAASVTIEALSDKRSHVREAAAWVLEMIAEPTSAPALIQALDDPRERVRASAAKALARIGSVEAAESLAALTGERSESVRRAAHQALVMLGPGVVERLVGALADERPAVREGIIRVLGGLGGPVVVEHLRRLLEDTNPAVRTEAARALVKIGSAGVRSLIAALGDQSESVRVAAVEALGEATDYDVVEPLVAAIGDQSESVRVAAVEALGEVGGPDVVEPLTAALGADSEPVVVAAIKALGEIGDRSAVDPLITALGGPVDEHPLPPVGYAASRIEMCRALGKLAVPRAIEALARCLRDPYAEDHGHWGTGDYFDVYFQYVSYPVSEAAAEALGRIGGPEANQALADWEAQGRPVGPEMSPLPNVATLAANRDIEGLIEALACTEYRQFQSRGDDSGRREVGAPVRKDAAEALGRLGDRRAAEALAERLSDYDYSAREAAARALEQLGFSVEQVKGGLEARAQEAAVTALIEAGHQELDLETRKTLVDKVVAIGPGAIELLQPALIDESRLVRKDVARILGAIGGPTAVASLAGLLSDEDSGVREAAAKALRRIGGPDAQRVLAGTQEAAVTELIEAGHQELDLETRKRLVDRIVAGGPPAIELLQPALTDESRLVRKDVARILGAIGGPAAVASLAGLLSDGDSGVRDGAAKALRRIGGPDAERLLAQHDSV